MSDLIQSIKSHITPDLLGQLSGKLGESESGISKAIGGLVPTLLGGIINKSSDSSGLGSVFSMLSNFNPGILGNLGSLVGQGNLAHNDPKDAAGSLLGSLFGSKVPAITDSIASFAGVKTSSASSLLGLVGPLVMGVLSKKIASENLSLASFSNLLNGQKSGILSALPGGMGSLLGLGGIKTPTPPKGSGGIWKWVLILIGLALLFFLWRACTSPMPPKVEPPKVDTLVKKVEATVDTTTTAITGFFRKLASGFEVKGNLDGIEGRLIGFVESDRPVDKTTWFNFDRVDFKTGSAEVDMERSREQLMNLAEIMKAYPKLKLKVGGYTDNTGDEAANRKLSQARAEAVVAALSGLGVEKGRLEAEGYGSQHPVGDNSTEEGRAQNRRIAVRVMEK